MPCGRRTRIPGLGRSASKLEPFVTLIQSFRAKLEYYTLKQLLDDIVESTGYVKELQESDDEDAEDRHRQHQRELISKVVAFEAAREDRDAEQLFAGGCAGCGY